jgi:hypothetical protein
MSKEPHFHHPADNFSHTILSVDGVELTELRDPVSAPLSIDASEQFSHFKFRLATTHGRKQLARMLVQKMYATRGYETGSVDTSTAPPDASLMQAIDDSPTDEPQAPAELTLVVSDNKERPRGTMSMIFDSDKGLPADAIFRDLLDPLRQEGRRLIEVGRLAIDRTEASKRLFAGMLHIFLIYATVIHRCTDCIIEVNPRHVGYYKRMLGWDVLSDTRPCPRVGAPAVLLRMKLGDMLSMAEALGGQGSRSKGERSLYPYFLSKEDSRGIAHRLLTDYLT